MSKSVETIIREEIGRDRDYLVSLRRYFHQHPETACQEFGTAERIEAELKSFGLKPERVGETGVYAEIKGTAKGPAKTIVLRADIDALPVTEKHECSYKSLFEGKMHACGHDSHTAALIGAAKYLAKHTDLFPGTVRLTFQAGEEIGYGARVFIDNGYLDGADRSFGLHTDSKIPVGKVSITPGPNNASVDWFRITVHGKGAHIAAPQSGIDALYVASQIVVSAQSIVTKLTSPIDNLLIGIGKLTSGKAYNVIADEAVMEGTIRAAGPTSRARAKQKLEEIAESAAKPYGATVSFEWKDNTSPLINDSEATREAQVVGERLLGKENIITDRPFSLGGDDFAEYIIKVPGVYAYVGTANENRPETCVAHHDCMFDIDEDSLPIMASLYAAYSVAFLSGCIEADK